MFSNFPTAHECSIIEHFKNNVHFELFYTLKVQKNTKTHFQVVTKLCHPNIFHIWETLTQHSGALDKCIPQTSYCQANVMKYCCPNVINSLFCLLSWTSRCTEGSRLPELTWRSTENTRLLHSPERIQTRHRLQSGKTGSDQRSNQTALPR